MRIVAVGKIGRGPEAELVARYAARLRPQPVIVEIPEARGTPTEVKRREAALILAAIPAGETLVALDLGGSAPDSAELAGWLDGWRMPCFAIGGAEGLDASVLARAAGIMSLGRLTWPHLLARAMLAEQLYRAQCIRTGHPYHRAGRP